VAAEGNTTLVDLPKALRVISTKNQRDKSLGVTILDTTRINIKTDNTSRISVLPRRKKNHAKEGGTCYMGNKKGVERVLQLATRRVVSSIVRTLKRDSREQREDKAKES
jgi:hypothetical protein